MPDQPAHRSIRATRRFLYEAPAAFAFSCFLLTLMTDIAYWATASILWETGSAWLLAVGLIAGGLAIIAAIFDWVRGLRKPLSILMAQATAFVLSFVNVFVHSRDGYTAVVPEGLVLSILVIVALAISAILDISINRGSQVGGLA